MLRFDVVFVVVMFIQTLSAEMEKELAIMMTNFFTS